MKNFLIALFGSLLLTACRAEPTEVAQTNNSEIKLELLFEHEGHKMYRFYDGQRAVYWSTAPGRTYYEIKNKNSNIKVDAITEDSVAGQQ